MTQSSVAHRIFGNDALGVGLVGLGNGRLVCPGNPLLLCSDVVADPNDISRQTGGVLFQLNRVIYPLFSALMDGFLDRLGLIDR